MFSYRHLHRMNLSVLKVCLEGTGAAQESDETRLVLRYSLCRGATNQTLKKGLNLVPFY